MGDNISLQENHKFEQKIQFFEEIEDKSFGSISVYRFIQPPYEYVMNYEKTFIEGDARVDGYQAQVQQIQKKEHKNIAKVHLCFKKKQNHMCIKDTKIHTFVNYYNFTLQQAIETKKMREGRFTEAELVFVLWCLVDVAKHLKKNGIIFGQFRPDRIFLTPEGYIKIYLLELEENNKHSAYYKVLVQRSLIQQYILAPEQLIMIQKMEYEPKFDLFKTEMFSIGMVLMELITLDKGKFYYNEEKSALKMGRINFDISSFGKEYSQRFINILKGCLMENPNQRLSLEQASHYVDHLRKNSTQVSYCLRLHDREDAEKKKKPLIYQKGQYNLNGVEKRLTPSPITTLSSSTSSGFQNKSLQSSQRSFK